MALNDGPCLTDRNCAMPHDTKGVHQLPIDSKFCVVPTDKSYTYEWICH